MASQRIWKQWHQRLVYGLCIIFFIYHLPAYSAPNFTYELHGISGAALTNVNDRLHILQNKHDKPLSPALARQFYLQARNEIKTGLEPYGYFRSSIHSQLFRQQGQWIAVYSINPGEPLHITNVNIQVTGSGKNNPAILNYIHQPPLKPGEIFTVPAYDEVKTTLFTIAKNQGYLRSYFQNQIIVDLRRYTCRISIHLETDSQFYFDHVLFETFPYSECFMRRFIDIQSGEVFSSQKLLTLQQAMEQSDYFNRVVLEPDFQHEHHHQIPIKAYLYPPKEKRYSLGLGYGTLTGPRVSGALSLRHLGNEGHHAEAEFKLSSILSTLSATYYIPGRNPLTDEWLVGVNVKHFEPNAGKSSSATLTGGYSKKFDPWETSITLNYLLDHFRIRPSPSHTSHMLYPSWNLSYLVTDDLANPQHAHSIDLTLRGASQAVLSTTSFAQIHAKAKLIFSPFSFARILLRGALGYTGVHRLPVFPMSLQYFAGGATSIRGFADSSIGPGKYLAIASGEYQNQIKGDLYGALFYDLGNATNHFHNRLNRGVGIGLIYNTRVGPLKAYLARAISKHTQPYSMEFIIGPEFS